MSLVGKGTVNGREAWVVEAKGKFSGHIGGGVGTHICLSGSTFNGENLRLYIDCETFALLKEVVLSRDEPQQVFSYGDFQPLGDHLVPMTIVWKERHKDWERTERLKMQIVGQKVWLLKRRFGYYRSSKGRRPETGMSLLAEVRDVQLMPLGDALFELPAPTAKELQGKHFHATYPKPLEPYAKALVQIGDVAWEAYQDLYGLPLPEPILLEIRLRPDQGERFASLWTDGQQHIFLEVGSEKPLLSPTKEGAHNVYGICHELAHIAFYHRMREVAGIPEGVAEGWAHYFGSVVTSYLFEKLGEQVYPDPHNYHETSGMGHFLRQLAEEKEDPGMLAAKVLYEAERKYGRQKLGKALNRTLAQRPSGQELVAKFADALVAVTGDPNAKAFIPEQSLKPKARMETKHPDIA